MKKVILIGDSVRLGYQDTVRQELAGAAEVIAEQSNGGTSRNVLAHLSEWVVAKAPSVVHVNCGLHDLRKDLETRLPIVPIDEYAVNVRKILERVRQETQAVVIWATTTPINEPQYHKKVRVDRYEADVLAYNGVAVKAAAELGVAINDLFALVMAAGRDAYLGEDGVHFSGDGSRLLGRAVADAVRRHL